VGGTKMGWTQHSACDWGSAAVRQLANPKYWKIFCSINQVVDPLKERDAAQNRNLKGQILYLQNKDNLNGFMK